MGAVQSQHLGKDWQLFDDSEIRKISTDPAHGTTIGEIK